MGSFFDTTPVANKAELQRSRDALERRQAAAHKNGQAQTRKKAKKWPEAHAQLCDNMGIDWWLDAAPPGETLDLYPGLQRLTERQFDLLHLMGVKYPDPRKACVELSQNQRNPKAPKQVVINRADIITPRGQQLVTHQARCLLGLEGLFLQGIHYGKEQFKVEEFDDDFLRDLAGNAFNSYCAAAIFITKQHLGLQQISVIVSDSVACLFLIISFIHDYPCTVLVLVLCIC